MIFTIIKCNLHHHSIRTENPCPHCPALGMYPIPRDLQPCQHCPLSSIGYVSHPPGFAALSTLSTVQHWVCIPSPGICSPVNAVHCPALGMYPIPRDLQPCQCCPLSSIGYVSHPPGFAALSTLSTVQHWACIPYPGFAALSTLSTVQHWVCIPSPGICSPVNAVHCPALGMYPIPRDLQPCQHCPLSSIGYVSHPPGFAALSTLSTVQHWACIPYPGICSPVNTVHCPALGMYPIPRDLQPCQRCPLSSIGHVSHPPGFAALSMLSTVQHWACIPSPGICSPVNAVHCPALGMCPIPRDLLSCIA